MKTVNLQQMLTGPQIRQCAQLYPDRIRIRDEVIVPHLPEINHKLGQENNADYLAYAIVYILGERS